MGKKQIKILFLALVCFLLCVSTGAVTVEAASTETETAATAATAKKTGLYKENGKYYYYKNGRKIKNKWKNITVSGKVRRYYFQADGSACTSVAKIDGTYYCFSKLGRLCRYSTNRLVTAGKYQYCPDKNGKCQTGWLLIGKKLYYASAKGRIQTSKTIDGIKLTKSGAASTSGVSAKLKIKELQVVSQITKSSMTKAQKLKACWNYVVGGRFGYANMSPNLKEKDWQKTFAYRMLVTKRGSCTSFACAFAALASAIGYDPVVVYGRVPGTRDQAADGYTRHCWVRIDGKYYDPEAQYAGWMRGVYAYSVYPISYQVTKSIKFETGK